MKRCINCDKECEHNYCSWECNIDAAKKDGGKVHTPNNLPIKCIKHDGLMLEHEHGDHSDYKYPVEVEFTGIVPDDLDELDGSYWNQTHALIYTDGYIAVTLYECTYAMWRVSSGKGCGGSLYDGYKEWKLTKTSLDKIGAK